MQINHFTSAIALLCLPLLAQGQSPVSGFMNGKGHGAIAVSYAAENYDNVFLVPNNAAGVPIFNEVKVNSISLYATYGLGDRFDVVLGLPYIKAKGNAPQAVLQELGFENERSGIQDVALFFKYNPYSAELGANRLDFILAAGLKTPLGNYKVDEGLQSIIAIGNRATSANGLAIAQFRTQSGFFLGAQAGYSLRSGRVPNALVGELKAGYGSRYFYVDAWYAGQVSDGGTNILGEGFDGFFPATDVTFTRAGLNLYVPIAGGLGVSVGASKYLTGRNIGEATGFSGAVVYSF
ncbi:MAG: hypothetical protein KF734_18745 [Saprospiraceae bacterium]|nr:hypothetical protein [Saprospiraceae bacterium]